MRNKRKITIRKGKTARETPARSLLIYAYISEQSTALLRGWIVWAADSCPCTIRNHCRSDHPFARMEGQCSYSYHSDRLYQPYRQQHKLLPAAVYRRLSAGNAKWFHIPALSGGYGHRFALS